jgi:hypothetical protein
MKEKNAYVMHNAGNVTEYALLAEGINNYKSGNAEPLALLGSK